VHSAASGISIKKVILVGNPNVGKSVVFGRITGKYALVSNYPGTTVEISRANLKLDGQAYEIIDTPGVNGLVPQSEDERVTRDMLLQERPDIVIQIGDAKNLRRTLLLTLQLAEFGIPMILDLNMIDECQSRGIEIDTEAIAACFGIPVNTSVATMGVGIYQLLRQVPQARKPRLPVEFRAPYLEGAAQALPAGLPAALALEWLANAATVDAKVLESLLPGPVLERLRALLERALQTVHFNPRMCFELERNHFLDTWIPRIRRQNSQMVQAEARRLGDGVVVAALLLGVAGHFSNWALPAVGLAGPYQWLAALFEDVVVPWARGGAAAVGGGWADLLFTPESGQGLLIGEFGLLHPCLSLLLCHLVPVCVPLFYALKHLPRFREVFERLSRQVWSGTAILLTCLSLVYVFGGYLGAQVLVGFMEDIVFGRLLSPVFRQGVALLPWEMPREMLAGSYGLFTMGLQYSVAIVFPVVATFFLTFGFLEDSGYLPRLSILAHQVFRRIGLSGKAVLPMVLGLGCDTMATLTTRILHSPKERLIATILLALGIPCSAQLGVLLGILAGVSFWTTLTVVLVVAAQLLLVGYLAGRVLPGEISDFVLEIPPLRYPVWGNILLKTWLRIVWFLKEAIPLFLLGTFLLFVMDRLAILERLTRWAEPVVRDLLGLPAAATHIFIMGFLRRDYGAAGLFELSRQGLLSANQIAVALVVLTLFVPCVANFFVIIKEQGFWRAVAIVCFIVPVAILTGGLVQLVLTLLRIQL